MPYWNRATYGALARALLTGRVIDGLALARLESLVVQTLGVEEALLCSSGSLALEAALEACGVGPGDAVVIPTFCCSAVVAPILAVGAHPVLADVGEELNLTRDTVAAALTENTKSVIVPHLFGNPADIGSVIDLAHAKNIRVIDDAAQAMGATIDGRRAGTFGTAGILSFGNEKVCSGVGGGVAVSRKPGTLPRHSVNQWQRPGTASSLWNLVATIVWRRWRRWTYPAHAWLGTRRLHSPPASYRRQTMSNLQAAVASNLMLTLNENIAARRARANAYEEWLGGREDLQLIRHRKGSACLTQVVRVLAKRPGEDSAAGVIQALGKAGYEIQGSYVPIHLLPDYESRASEHFPYAERVWEDLIELPCEPDVSFEDVERITTLIVRFLDATRRHSALHGGAPRYH